MTNRLSGALAAIAIVLTCATLDRKSFWLDEAFSVWSAGRSVNEIWTTTDDPHPPLYYLVLHGWPWRQAGEAGARWPSALAGGISLVFTFVIARRMWNRDVAWLVLPLAAWAPLHVWYSQEARMYAFLELGGLLMAFGLVLESRLGLAVLAFGLALSLFLDYTAVLVWAVLSGLWEGGWVVGDRRRWPRLAGWWRQQQG